MVKRVTGTLTILILLTATGSLAQQEEKILSLSLEDCILKAMKNNLNVAIEVLNPELSDISVSLAKEKFMPSLSLNFLRRDTNSASYSFLDAADQVSTLSDDYSAQITQLIPTGGSYSLVLEGDMYNTNRNFQTINPRYGNTLTFSLTQPLLKDFGFKVSRKEIIVAKNNRDISENTFKRTLQDTIYSVEEAYWNLVYSIENLKVRQQSLKLAQDLLERNRRAVEVGSLAPIEILNAQADVATREADILEAEAMVKNNEDLLKTIINLAAEVKGVDLVKITPKDKPAYEETEVNLNQALLMALENRPDLNATRIDLKNKELDLSYTRNQLLPDLSIQASYWSDGVTGDQIVYENDDALRGAVIGTIPGTPTDALKDVFDFKYQNWSIGLTLSIPINNIISRAAYAQARVNLDQALLSLKNQEQQIFLEIKTAVRSVETNFKRAQAYKIARELAEKKLEAEEEKLRVGLSTNYFVLQYQRDLATAQSQELKALIDYNLSLALLNKASGISLKNKNIRISEILRN